MQKETNCTRNDKEVKTCLNKGTGSAFVFRERPVISCHVWGLVLLQKEGALEALPKKTQNKPKYLSVPPVLGQLPCAACPGSPVLYRHPWVTC